MVVAEEVEGAVAEELVELEEALVVDGTVEEPGRRELPEDSLVVDGKRAARRKVDRAKIGSRVAAVVTQLIHVTAPGRILILGRGIFLRCLLGGS